MERKPVVVCVDDEQMILNSLNKQLLRKYGEQFDLEFCESGEEALELIETLTKEKYNVVMVISDQIMPGMPGDEFLIRVHEKYPRIIKILLTGQAAIESAMNAVNKADLYRYITKPWNEEDLLMTIERGLQQYFLQQDKVLLLSEVHHRVKNNLAIIAGLLQLQSQLVNEEQGKEYLLQSVNRISSIAKVHELIYESDTVSSIDIKKYLERLVPAIVTSMSSNQKQITYDLELKELNMGINQVVSIGLLLNELITNSVKHAFADKSEGNITIRMSKSDRKLKVIYEDNGSGLESQQVFNESKSLGLTLVRLQLEQLEADYEIQAEGHFKLEFSFPVTVSSSVHKDEVRST